MTLLTSTDGVIDTRAPIVEQDGEFNSVRGNEYLRSLLNVRVNRWFAQCSLPWADHVFAISQGVANQLKEIYGVPEQKISLLPLAVDTEIFDPERFPESENQTIANKSATESEPLRLVYIGSIASFRGIDIIIRGLYQCDISVEFHIAGTGFSEDIEELKTLSAEIGVQNRVTWHGYIEHDQIPKLLSETDVGVSALPDLDSYSVSAAF